MEIVSCATEKEIEILVTVWWCALWLGLVNGFTGQRDDDARSRSLLPPSSLRRRSLLSRRIRRRRIQDQASPHLPPRLQFPLLDRAPVVALPRLSSFSRFSSSSPSLRRNWLRNWLWRIGWKNLEATVWKWEDEVNWGWGEETRRLAISSP